MNSNNRHILQQINYPLEASLFQHQGGKGILIQNLVLKIYRDCFERIWIVSPTAHIDEAYKEVIKYIEKDLKVDNKKEQFLFDEYDGNALQQIIDTQHKVIEYQKKNKMKRLFSCLLIIDDFAEDRVYEVFKGFTRSLHKIKTLRIVSNHSNPKI